MVALRAEVLRALHRKPLSLSPKASVDSCATTAPAVTPRSRGAE